MPRIGQYEPLRDAPKSKRTCNYDKDYFHNIYEYTKEEEKFKSQAAYMKLVTSRKDNINRILDVGCGYGFFLRLCDLLGLDTYGVDIADFALKRAAETTKAKLLNLDVSKKKLPFDDNFFDVVTVLDCLEHIAQEYPFLKEVYRVLTKNGLLFCTTPNKRFLLNKFLSDRDPSHINVQSNEYWRNRLQEVGFKSVEVKGCVVYGFPPFEPLRKIFRFSLIRPIFTSFTPLAQELLLFARKLDATVGN